MTDWRRLAASNDLADLFASEWWQGRKRDALHRLKSPSTRDPHDIAQARTELNMLETIEVAPRRQLEQEREGQMQREIQEAQQTRAGALAVARARRRGQIPSGPVDLRVAASLGLVPDDFPVQEQEEN